MRQIWAFHLTGLAILWALLPAGFGCNQNGDRSDSAVPSLARRALDQPAELGARDILGNPDFLAFCYGGYRGKTRDNEPTVDELKEDMRILSALGVKLLRTYNTQQYAHAANLLKAIDQLRKEKYDFEMYLMLGAWIECEGAWTTAPNHDAENVEKNRAEVNAAIELANAYPEIVKMIAVGNEAMVHWATSYFVRPAVIQKWVDHLQGLKLSGGLPAHIWITSSDNFAAWGGGDASYHTSDLASLIESVDFVSLHLYPFHDSYHDPKFWIAPAEEEKLSVIAKADAAMQRAMAHARLQYRATANYIQSLGVEKPIHIGETGWASRANSFFGKKGSRAADEYKAKSYYEAVREWTNNAGMSCFYFEAFDEPWKDPRNVAGAENHFGLFTRSGQAKYALWDHVDAGVFVGLTRDGAPITKTHDEDEATIFANVLEVPSVNNLGGLATSNVNQQRSAGELVTEGKYVVFHQSMVPDPSNDMTYPSDFLKLTVWEGTCGMEMSNGGVIHVSTGTGRWWGCALELQGGGTGEDLSLFKSGRIHMEIKGDTTCNFNIGFQTGRFTAGTQVDNYVTFGPDQKYQLSKEWASYSISVAELDQGGNLTDVTGLLFLKGDRDLEGKSIEIRNVYFSQD